MELQYVCLALGFGGKYQLADRGHASSRKSSRNCFAPFAAIGARPPKELSLHWRGMQDRRNPIIRYVPWWVVGAFTLVVLTGAFIYFHSQLATFSAPIDERLANIGLTAVPTSTATVAHSAAPRLKQLCTMMNREACSASRNGATRQSLHSSAAIYSIRQLARQSALLAPLQRVAHALNEVPGRVFVVGHTDDQPVRSYTTGQL